jgi:hypothetical protein
LSIIRPGPGKLAINAAGQSQIFSIPQFFTVSISGLTFENGAGSVFGGAIDDNEEHVEGFLNLTLTDDVVTDNSAGGPGEYGEGGAVLFVADGGGG